MCIRDSTYTEEGNEHVHVRGTGNEGLTKRQYIVHVFINAGDSEDNTHGYVDMIRRGAGKRIS